MDNITLSPHPSCQIRRLAADLIERDPRQIDSIVVYFSRLGAPMYVHDLFAVAETIAQIEGCRFGGLAS
jgi:hypothetical protein